MTYLKGSGTPYLHVQVTDRKTLCRLIGVHRQPNTQSAVNFQYFSYLPWSSILKTGTALDWICLPKRCPRKKKNYPSAIHRINRYLMYKYTKTNCNIHWIVINPLDSAIDILKNWAQEFSIRNTECRHTYCFEFWLVYRLNSTVVIGQVLTIVFNPLCKRGTVRE